MYMRHDITLFDGDGRERLLELALAYRAFAVENEALHGLMFERAAPDFVPSDDSRLAGLGTFEALTGRETPTWCGRLCTASSRSS